MPIFCRITIDKEEARFGIKKDVNHELIACYIISDSCNCKVLHNN